MNRTHSALRRAAFYGWAGPNTLLGLMAGAIVLCLGGKASAVDGTIEFCGGAIGSAAARMPRSMRFGAMTLGHVVIGIDAQQLLIARAHERVHVRQYERWGPLFLPAYACSSLWQLLHGRRAYRDNVFECEAYADDAARASKIEQGDPEL